MPKLGFDILRLQKDRTPTNPVKSTFAMESGLPADTQIRNGGTRTQKRLGTARNSEPENGWVSIAPHRK